MKTPLPPLSPFDEVFKRLGKNVSDHQPDTRPIRFQSTGLPNLDAALGVPGLPLGRTTIIYGESSTGKSTILYQIMAAFQRAGGLVVHMETENSLTPAWIKKFGVNPDQLFIRTPPYMQAVTEVFDQLLEQVRDFAAEHPVLFSWDSVSQTPTKAEVQDVDSTRPGEHSRILSQWFRHFTGPLAEAQIGLVLVTQKRENIAMAGAYPGMDTSTMLGSRPLKFASTIMLEVRRLSYLRKTAGAEPYGVRMRLTTTKNKIAPPQRTAELSVDFQNGGIDVDDAYLQAAVLLGLVTQSKSWYKYETRSFHAGDWADLAATTDILPALAARMEAFFAKYADYQPYAGDLSAPDVVDVADELAVEEE